MRDLTQGNITSILLRFAIPIVFSRVFQLCYSLADTRIIGGTLGDSSLAAIGASSTFYQLLLTFITGLTSGFAIVIARYFGAHDECHFRQAVAGTFRLGAVIGVGMTVLSLLSLPWMLQILNIEDALLPESRVYIQIVLLGLLLAALYNLCAGVLYGVGDSFTPLVFLIISTVGNIGLDILLVMVFPFGVAGAAVGTVLAQGFSAVGCLIYMLLRYPALRLQKADFAVDVAITADLLKTGFSCGLMQSMINLGSLTLQITINGLGETYIVAQTAARRISEILMMPFIALASAMGTFASQNLGSGKLQRIRAGYQQSILLLWVWCAVVLFISYTLSPWLVQLITATQSQETIDAATQYLRIDTLFYFTLPLIIVSRQTLQSLGDRIMPVISSGIECVGKVVIAFTLARQIGYMGIILAEPIVWFIMVIPLLISLKKRMPPA
jgi:putative MATE family efflux protein